jgi:MurNAc alpha-1-phosphate uridylyltransferase
MEMMPDAMILAAGLGTRLRPITQSMPKPLIPIGGKALIDRVIEASIAEGVSRFAINIHAHAGQMHAHIAQLRRAHRDCRFRFADETLNLLGTEGGVRSSLRLIETDPFLVANADSFWPEGADRPLKRMMAAMSDDADIVLLCVSPKRATGFRGAPDFDFANGHLVPPGKGEPVIYAGRALMRRWLFDAPPPGTSLGAHFHDAMDVGRLKGVMLEADWLHVGDPAAIVETEARLAGG